MMSSKTFYEGNSVTFQDSISTGKTYSYTPSLFQINTPVNYFPGGWGWPTALNVTNQSATDSQNQMGRNLNYSFPLFETSIQRILDDVSHYINNPNPTEQTIDDIWDYLYPTGNDNLKIWIENSDDASTRGILHLDPESYPVAMHSYYD